MSCDEQGDAVVERSGMQPYPLPYDWAFGTAILADGRFLGVVQVSTGVGTFAFYLDEANALDIGGQITAVGEALGKARESGG